jgi:hypothetical protein
MTKELFEKLESLEKDIAHEKRDFSLFGLFLREDARDRWDLIVAAPWINADSMEHLKYIADKLKTFLKDRELLLISRIVLLDLNDPIVQTINKNWGVQRGGSLELNNPQIFGLPFQYAYIIISQGSKTVLVHVGKRKLRQTA